MSAPSSDGRISIDTEPSATSSSTLYSRKQSRYQDDGGEGPSHRPGTGARSHGGSAKGVEGSKNRNFLSVDSALDEGLASRKQRVRRSGGFLLESGFPSGPRAEHSRHIDGKPHGGKRASRYDGAGEQAVRKKVRSKKDTSSSGSSPLSQQMRIDELRDAPGTAYHDYGTQHGQENGRLRVGKTRHSLQQPLTYDRALSPNTAPQRQTIDPNQLVHMALNLSESRRRNISTGQMLASQARAPSSAQREGSFSNHGAGSSLRQYLNEQRRTSRNISPMGGKGSPSRQMSSSVQRNGSMAFAGPQSVTASAATMARVEKARTYIELGIEYLRLLDHLPPLKPDANAPGNFVTTSHNVPGSPQAQLTRVPSHAGKQHDLGRPYNPLQYIRNRRTRARERQALDHPPEEFLDVEQVQEWVDRVEELSRRPGYRRDDTVQLPKYHADRNEVSPPSKPPRPHKGWLFTPEELLADAHWLEQAENKFLVENRHGRRIFPPKEIEIRDFLDPRVSKEHPDDRRKSWVDNVIIDPGTDNESDRGSERGRRLRLLPALRTDSPRAMKHSRRGSRLRNKVDSDTSDSDIGSRKRKPRIGADAEHNTGPLALLLEQQAKASQTISPSVRSPDTPDKWDRRDGDLAERQVGRDSLDVPKLANGFNYVKDNGNFKVPTKPRNGLALNLDDIEPRSSIDDWDSTAPNTPLQPKRFPHIGTDLSPPPSRAGSETKKSKRRTLNPFHVHDHKSEKHDLRPDSSGIEKKASSRQPSEEIRDEKHVGSGILAAPGAVRNLLAHRKNDSVSSLPSPDKLQRRDTQEPHSAVTRFLKGVKHEGSKVGEFIFRRDRADDSDGETTSDRNSLDFDTDASLKNKRAKRPAVNRIASADTARSVSGNKSTGRSHLELPSFRPLQESQFSDRDNSDFEHHISRQARERKNNRSPRFDRLAPPRMDLGTLSGNSSDRSLSPTRSHSQDRISKALARPGAGEIPGLFPTALRNTNRPDRRRSGSRPTLDGQRHWSITDDDEHQLRRKKDHNEVSQADIARVRALFLCSGVKAKELERRAQEKRSPPPDFLAKAAETAKVQLYPVARKEEHVLAARILVKDLETSTKSLQSSLETFRDKAIKELASQISALQSTIDSDLMPRILQSGEQAVHITSEVSNQGPLQVKEITDEIDRMLRERRRRIRYIRSFGWMLVEWALVAVMWWLWLVVVLVGSVKRVLGFGVGVVRWLLWL